MANDTLAACAAVADYHVVPFTCYWCAAGQIDLDLARTIGPPCNAIATNHNIAFLAAWLSAARSIYPTLTGLVY